MEGPLYDRRVMEVYVSVLVTVDPGCAVIVYTKVVRESVVRVLMVKPPLSCTEVPVRVEMSVSVVAAYASWVSVSISMIVLTSDVLGLAIVFEYVQ